MGDTFKQEKGSTSAEKDRVMNVLWSFWLPFAIALSVVNILFGGVGRISYTSLFMVLVLFSWGYLGFRSVRGALAMSLWDVFALVLPPIVFMLKGQEITSFFMGLV